MAGVIDLAEGRGRVEYEGGGVSAPGLLVDARSRLICAGLGIRMTVVASGAAASLAGVPQLIRPIVHEMYGVCRKKAPRGANTACISAPRGL